MTDGVLDKVRKLLAKAEDPACAPAEAEAFTAKAAELIAKYGVDRARLAGADPASDPLGDRVLDIPAPYAEDKCSLLAGVAGVLRCQSVQRRSWTSARRWSLSMHLFGHRSDLARVDVLFTSLLVQASLALAAQTIPRRESVAAYRRSWLAGYTRAVVLRLRAAEERAVADASGPSMALVLADRGAAVRRRFEEAYPEVRFVGPRRRSGGGRARGYAVGQRADLGGVRVGGGLAGRALPAGTR